MIDVSLVCVATFDDPIFAHIAKSRLYSSGIPAVLDGEHHVAMHWFITNAVGGIKLLVRSSDYDAAVAALNDNSSAALDDLQFNGEQSEVGNDRVLCPLLCSKETYRERLKRKWIFISILLLGVPVPILSSKMICETCNYTWER